MFTTNFNVYSKTYLKTFYNDSFKLNKHNKMFILFCLPDGTK